MKGRACECEHVSHFEDVPTPLGKTGHLYGQRFAKWHKWFQLTEVERLTICKDCASDCCRQFSKKEVDHGVADL